MYMHFQDAMAIPERVRTCIQAWRTRRRGGGDLIGSTNQSGMISRARRDFGRLVFAERWLGKSTTSFDCMTCRQGAGGGRTRRDETDEPEDGDGDCDKYTDPVCGYPLLTKVNRCQLLSPFASQLVFASFCLFSSLSVGINLKKMRAFHWHFEGFVNAFSVPLHDVYFFKKTLFCTLKKEHFSWRAKRRRIVLLPRLELGIFRV